MLKLTENCSCNFSIVRRKGTTDYDYSKLVGLTRFFRQRDCLYFLLTIQGHI